MWELEYADDIAIAYHSKDFATADTIILGDLERLDEYFLTWKHKRSVAKREACVFHLNNKCANYTPQIQFRGQQLRYNPFPKYGCHLRSYLDLQRTSAMHVSESKHQKHLASNNEKYLGY